MNNIENSQNYVLNKVVYEIIINFYINVEQWLSSFEWQNQRPRHKKVQVDCSQIIHKKKLMLAKFNCPETTS